MESLQATEWPWLFTVYMFTVNTISSPFLKFVFMGKWVETVFKQLINVGREDARSADQDSSSNRFNWFVCVWGNIWKALQIIHSVERNCLPVVSAERLGAKWQNTKTKQKVRGHPNPKAVPQTGDTMETKQSNKQQLSRQAAELSLRVSVQNKDTELIMGALCCARCPAALQPFTVW